MIIYAFKNKYGRGIDREYPMGEAPTEIVVDGDTYHRDYSVVRLGRTKDESFVSISTPLKGSRYDDPTNPAPHYTKDGRAAFANRRQAREWAKRSEKLGGSYAYDPD